MSIKLNEVSFSVSVGAEGHVNVTQTVMNLVPSLKAEQIHIDKRVYEDNDSIVYDDDEGDKKPNENGDIILDFKAYGNKEQQNLHITAIITHR
jgi:hypothetical protein